MENEGEFLKFIQSEIPCFSFIVCPSDKTTQGDVLLVEWEDEKITVIVVSVEEQANQKIIKIKRR